MEDCSNLICPKQRNGPNHNGKRNKRYKKGNSKKYKGNFRSVYVPFFYPKNNSGDILRYWASASFDTNIDIQYDRHMTYDNVIYAKYDINDKKGNMTYVI